MFALSPNCTVQHPPVGETHKTIIKKVITTVSRRPRGRWHDTSNAVRFNAALGKNATAKSWTCDVTRAPQVLDFFPHHGNLLVQPVEVLAAAATQRTHPADPGPRQKRSGHFSGESAADRPRLRRLVLLIVLMLTLMLTPPPDRPTLTRRGNTWDLPDAEACVGF